jgi:anti-sigma regulatory factor (Ser/Thr protein kinase)
MSGTTGAIAAECDEARLAGSEHDSGAGTASSPWPLQTRLELAAQRTAPGVVRGHVRAVACEWGLAGLADTAELLASEIATNAVLASGQLSIRADLAVVPVIRLCVTSDGVCLTIHVWDGSDQMPVLKDFAVDEENGRGLFLVATLGKDWGAYRKKDGGKVVWVMITAADP